MEFKSDDGMIVKNFIIEGGKIQIIDTRDLYFISCDFRDTAISCPGGENELFKITRGCTFTNCEFSEDYILS